MKQKKIGKKLNLNKKTIAALDSRQIKAAYGIDTGESYRFCVYCGTECHSFCTRDTVDTTCPCNC